MTTSKLLLKKKSKKQYTMYKGKQGIFNNVISNNNNENLKI